jgi:hypothetical protein
MIKFIRKNQKKMLAIASVVLMIFFIKGLAPQGTSQGFVARTVGTLGGAKVTTADIASAANEWKLLMSLQFVDPNDPDRNSGPLVLRLLGNDLASEIQKASMQNQPLFFLLIQEAHQQGIVVTPEQFQTFITSYVRPLPDEGTPGRESVDLAVADALTVHNMIQRMGNVVKVSQPMQRYAVAREFQMLTLKFVPIQASHYLDGIARPTEEKITAQYDAFKDHLPAVPRQIPSEYGSTDDPLGFGYKVPDRVALQYINIDNAELRNAAIASKSKEDWYIAAYGEFTKNRDTYDAQPISTNGLIPSSGNAPTTQRVENLQDDFQIHAQAVVDTLYDHATDDLRDKVLKDLNDRLSAGFGEYRDQQNAAAANPSSPVPATRPGQYASYEYLASVADSLQQQYGVRASVANIQQMKTAEQLSQMDKIGKAYLQLPGTQRPIGFAMYAAPLFQPFISDAAKAEGYGPLALSPWQASNPLTDADHNVFIFRVTGYDPAHTAPLADVRDKVIADFKLAGAYAKAQAAAQKLADAAGKSGLETAAIAAGWPAPIETDPFVPSLIQSGQRGALISPLNLSQDSVFSLAAQSLELLSLPTMGDRKPLQVAPLPADALVAVIELNSAIPTLQSTDQAIYQARLMAEITQQTQGIFLARLCSFDEVSHRLDYVPEQKAQ